MANWNSYIFLKTNVSLTDTDEISKWSGVNKIWSTSGEWDWVIKLNEDHSTPEKTEEFVSNIRNIEWIADSSSKWWKEVYSKS